MSQHADSYPYLENLLGSWFHQDFDLDGDVPDIVAKVVATTHRPAAWAVVADIERFLMHHRADADRAFVRLFKPDIDPAGWKMTTAAWLEWVARLLTEQLTTP